MIQRVRTWWKARRLANESARLRKEIESFDKRLLGALERFETQRIEILNLVNTLRAQVKRLDDDIEGHDRSLKSYEAENEALRTKVSILEKIAVPGLTQTNQCLLERLNAMTAQEVRNQVMFKASE